MILDLLDPSTAARRLRAAWKALTVDPTSYDRLQRDPVTAVACAVDPHDVAQVYAFQDDVNTPPLIAVAAGNAATGIGTAVMMLPSVARAFAAGILNAADEAAGDAPLMFMPGGDA